MDGALREVLDTMLRHPKSPIRAMYEGPRGGGSIEASVIYDGDRRWRIGTADVAHLDDGTSAYSVEATWTVATRSGGMAAFNFLKAMIEPRRFADLDGRLPIEGTAAVAGTTTAAGRECWVLRVGASTGEQHWLIDRMDGYVLAIQEAAQVARLFALTPLTTVDASLFEWHGDVDEDYRRAV